MTHPGFFTLRGGMMNDDLTPYRWQDYVITPQRSAANLLATVLVMILVGGAVVLGAPDDPARAPSGTIAQATEREPCLALIARRIHSSRVNHLL
jgi:hypothetical protein